MPDHQIAIVADKCKKDGLCAKVCPSRIFEWQQGQLPSVHRAEHCVLCGQCIAICPSDGITHSRLDRAKFERIEHRSPAEPAALVDFLRQRRSVRAYSSRSVDRELLASLAGVAGFAPTSAHGGEGWVRSVTLVEGEAEMRKLIELTVEYLRELRALLDSSMVKWMSKLKIEPRRARGMLHDLDMRLSEYDQGRDAILYNAPAAIFVHTPILTHDPHADCDSALFLIMMAAHAHGLGTCWNGWIAKAADAFKAKRAKGLRRWLKIPDDHIVGAAVTIGYPAFKLHSLPPRETSVRWAEKP